MNRDPLRTAGYLAHIVEAIERIARYTAGRDGATGACDPPLRDTVILDVDGYFSNASSASSFCRRAGSVTAAARAS